MGFSTLDFRNEDNGYSCIRVIGKWFFAFLLSAGFMQSPAQSVLTQHNDLKRTGWDAGETTLTQATVSGGSFGKLFQREVDDQIYCQPLIVNNVSIGGNNHNIVIVATVNNSVYAFDADDAAQTDPLWQVSLTYSPGTYRPIKNKDMTGACGGFYNDFSGNMGIVGTPVIDGPNKALYVVARSVTNDGSSFVQYLHKLNILTGVEMIPPVFITATYPGNGDGSSGGVITFNQQTANQRPALLLYNGVVFISWASHCDWGPYHGWIIGYDAADLSQKYVYNASPGGSEVGIWMSGQAPAVDDNGFIYVSTGNGTVGVSGNPNDISNRGESLIKLSTASGTLKAVDFFTPADYSNLNAGDMDYGCDGVLLIPNTNLSLSGSKESWLYLIDNTNMGGWVSDMSNSNVKQLLDVNVQYNGDKHLHGSPAYYKDDKAQEYIYAWAEDGLLKQFPFNRSTLLFDIPNVVIGNTTLPYGMPGAMLSVSSNGNVAGTGILWASHPINGDANQNVVPGILQAFDATDVTHELWNSNLNGIRDSVGKFAKFVTPTIANGKVYLATFSNNLKVYGLNAQAAASCPDPLPTNWLSADIGYVIVPGSVCYDGSTGTYTAKASGADIGGTTDGFHDVYQKVTGNKTTITARVVSISANANAGAKAGVMFRTNLDAGSPNIFMGITKTGGAVFQSRPLQNGSSSTSTIAGIASPYWVRIVGNGNVYNAYISADGLSWGAPVGTITLALGTNIYVGLSYTNRNNGILSTAVFDNVEVLQDPGTLPVTLTDFTASNVNNLYGLLNWKTAAEINFDHFEIERSTASSDFKLVGSVPGNAQAAGDQLYQFTDKTPSDGANYYRLKMVDKDGKYAYSKVLLVTFNLSIIQLYPNPAKDKIFLKNNIHFTNGAPLEIELINNAGQHLLNTSIPTAGLDELKVLLPPGIKSGVYFLRAINGKGQKQSWKLLIQN